MNVCLFVSGSEEQRAALRLLAVSKLINQAVGDALSGLLLVEAILHHMGWSIYKWNELYNDLPSRQLKVSLSFLWDLFLCKRNMVQFLLFLDIVSRLNNFQIIASSNKRGSA